MTLSEPQIIEWGRSIGRAAVERDEGTPLVLALRGELGAGKSVLARAVARGAGVTSPMPSPTFNLVFVYEADRGVSVYHLDLYRLVDPNEVWELGWRELGEGRQVVAIEWPERAEAWLPNDRWDIELVAPHAGSPLREVRARRVGEPPAIPSPEPVAAS